MQCTDDYVCAHTQCTLVSVEVAHTRRSIHEMLERISISRHCYGITKAVYIVCSWNSDKWFV